jgi:hypothetical protein
MQGLAIGGGVIIGIVICRRWGAELRPALDTERSEDAAGGVECLAASMRSRRRFMSEGSDIAVLYREFADALTELLAENAVGPARRGRLARARAAIKKHPNYSDAGYLRAVEAAFENWEAMQKAGR